MPTVCNRDLQVFSNFNTFRPSLELSEFVPETYKLDLKREREAFYAAFKGLNFSSFHTWEMCESTFVVKMVTCGYASQLA